MWTDLVLGPFQVRRSAAQGLRPPLMLIWDNCGSHTVPALDAVFSEHNVHVRQLPPRMTSVLQVMDLMVNGPVKAAIRKARCVDLMDYLRQWKAERAAELAKPEDQRRLPAFSPSKPTLNRGLDTVMRAVHGLSASDQFQLSMKKMFFALGQAKDPVLELIPGSTGFRKYPGHAHIRSVSKSYEPPTEAGIARLATCWRSSPSPSGVQREKKRTLMSLGWWIIFSFLPQFTCKFLCLNIVQLSSLSSFA